MCPLFSNQVSSRLHLKAIVLNSVPTSIGFSTIVQTVPSENKYSQPTFCFLGLDRLGKQARLPHVFYSNIRRA